MKSGSLLATRRSLVERLRDWDDQQRWQQFFDTYSKLIYSAARKSGLTDAESQEVVQETVITVAKNIGKLRYDPELGSFKGWLLNITRWRIADQFRKRLPEQRQHHAPSQDRDTLTIERFPGGSAHTVEDHWEQEWKQNLWDAAITRLKKKIEPKQFQLFDCYVQKQWPAKKVAEHLRVSIGQVYLARHRVSAMLKKEISALQKKGW
jgi:RNA polymerase sigma-70 factor (ECF subfamily)